MTTTAPATPSGAAAALPSGLEVLRRLTDGPRDAVGVMRLIGGTPETVEHGRVVFRAPTRGDFANPMGTLHGGIAATLLDSAMGCAVMSTLPPGAGYATVDLHVTYLRPAGLDGVVLRAEGTAVHTGGRVATAEGRLTDPDGRLVATAVCTCAVLGP